MDAHLLRRPNGRPQACEPCRRRKVACDHAQPICRRCIKRRQEGDCVYLVSSNRHRAPSVASTSPPPALSPRLPEDQTSAPVHSRLPNPDCEITTSVQPSNGYLGYTSYSSVYEETESALGVTTTTTTPDADCISGMSKARKPSPRIMNACLKILGYVPDPENGMEQFRQFPTTFDGFPHAIGQRILHSLYDTFGRYLGRNRNPRDLEFVVRRLCANTARPFSELEADADRWIDQFLGENLRWEALGVLFTFWDLYQTVDGLPRYTYQHNSKFTGRVFATREILRLCLDVSTEFSSGNTLSLYISHKCGIAESMFSGDASLPTWRAHADTIALLTFLGFHAEPNPPSYKPTLPSEIRRNLFAWIYNMDTVTASFTGRPPLLSSSYTSTPLPLDLCDDELMDKAAMARALRGLDTNGWKVQPRLGQHTFTRARAMLGLIREEVFRIALGYGQTTSLDTILQLRAREIQTFAQIPSVLHYQPSDLRDPRVDPVTLSSKLLVQLEHLQNILFLERLSLRHGKMDRADIIAVSYEMVSDTLPFWTHQDRLAPMRDDCEWLVMAHAAPAGGILCLELLKPTLLNGHPSNHEITRSSIIQKLSLLVGFLDWIKPSAPNSELCANCRVVTQHVLDVVLNAAATGEAVPEPFEWELGAPMDFNFELMDTFDWLRPDVS